MSWRRAMHFCRMGLVERPTARRVKPQEYRWRPGFAEVSPDGEAKSPWVTMPEAKARALKAKAVGVFHGSLGSARVALRVDPEWPVKVKRRRYQKEVSDGS